PTLRAILPQDQREDAGEGQDREDDPEDAHAQVAAVQPLRGSDLLTRGAHSGSHVADITLEGIFPAVAKQIRQVSFASRRGEDVESGLRRKYRRRYEDPYFCMYRVLSS